MNVVSSFNQCKKKMRSGFVLSNVHMNQVLHGPIFITIFIVVMQQALAESHRRAVFGVRAVVLLQKVVNIIDRMMASSRQTCEGS